jgi:uncharacterized protein (TIGR03437 family)
MSRFFSRLLLVAAALPFGATAAVVARYTFEEGQNGATAVNAVTDSSGNSFHGVPVNRPIYTAVNQPNSSLGLRFNGSQRVVIAHRPQLELHKSFAVELSVFLDSCPGTGGRYDIVWQGDDRPGNDPVFIQADQDCRIRVAVTDDRPRTLSILSKTSLQPRVWYRLQALLDDDADALVLSINGVEEARIVTDMRATRTLDRTQNPSLVLGATSTGTGGFVGIIDDVAVRNDAAATGVPKLTKAVNAASFTEALTASSWVTLGGTDFSPVTREWTGADFQNGRLPTSLDGVSVSVNGRNAAVSYISGGQVNILTPNDDAVGPVEIVITTRTGTSRVIANLARHAPGFFMLTPPAGRSLERRYGVVTMVVDGASRLIGPPGYLPGVELLQAAPGDVITFWGTGFGPTDPVVPTDRAFAGAAPLRDAGAFQLRVGDIVAEKQFVGMVSNGLYQLNVVVPNLPSGEYRVLAEVGGTMSPPIWLAIGERTTAH